MSVETADKQIRSYKRSITQGICLLGVVGFSVVVASLCLDERINWLTLSITLTGLIGTVGAFLLSKYTPRYLLAGALVNFVALAVILLELWLTDGFHLSGAHLYVSVVIISSTFLCGNRAGFVVLNIAVINLLLMHGYFGLQIDSEIAVTVSTSIDRIAAPILVYLVMFHANRATEKAIMISKQQQEALDIKNKLSSMGVFVGGIAHEIKNPLATIQGSTQILMQVYEKHQATLPAADSKAFEKWLGKIDRNSERIRQIIEAMLNLAQPKSEISKKALVRHISIRACIDEALRMEQDKLQKSSISIVYSIPSYDGVLVNGENYHLVSVIRVIVDNAIDALGEIEDCKHPQKKSIVMRVEKFDGGAWQLEIEDNGPGIPKDIIERIQEPYYTTKTEGQGSGIGLALVFGIAQALNWDIEVSSEPQKTVFRIRFPSLSDI